MASIEDSKPALIQRGGQGVPERAASRTPRATQATQATRATIAMVLLAIASVALGADVGGVQFPDRVRVAPDSPDLTLNGAGERWMLLFKIYAIGLYLPQRKSTIEDVLATHGPKRLLLIMQRDLTGRQVHDYLVKRIEDQNQAAEMSVLRKQMDDLDRIIDAVGMIRTNGTIALDWVPGKGTVIRVNDVARGTPIPGEEFYQALLRIWLSERAKSLPLRDALLGKNAG